MKEICNVCGCTDLVVVDRLKRTYRCRACDALITLAEDDPKPVSAPAEPKATPVASVAGKSAADIYRKNIGGIMEVTSTFAQSASCGTGFFLTRNGYLLTNAHVVVARMDAKNYQLALRVSCSPCHSDRTFPLDIVYLDGKNDLALLKADANVSPLRLALRFPEIGEKVFAIGNGRGDGLALVDGIISDVDRTFLGHPAFLFNALVTNGCSGGPVFNDRGDVCGVTVGQMQDAVGMNYGIPLDVVRTFLHNAEREKGITLLLG